MKELFERLARFWPKDSEWQCFREEDSFILNREGDEEILDGAWDDIDNAAARTIIEDELIRLGRPVQVTFDAGYQNWCAYLPTTYIPHPDDPSRALNAEFVTPGMIYKGAPTRTQALLTVAVEAFEAASKGEEPT